MVATTQPSKEQWDEIEAFLRFPGAAKKLRVDGYEITIAVESVKLKMMLVIYVNGCFKGEWITNDCEERRRFLRPSSNSVYSAKLLKGVSKRDIKKFGLNKKNTFYTPIWNSFRSLKRHLINNSDVIEVVS